MWIGSYARRSRALGDPKNVDVVAHQLTACDRLAADDGVTIPESNRIAEIGSGESLRQRPRFAQLLREFEAHRPEGGGVLYTPEVSRLTRAEAEEAGRVQRILREAGILVKVIGYKFDLRRPIDEMLFGMLLIQGRLYNQLYRQQVSVKQTAQLEQGVVRLGAAPWGYLWDKGEQRLHAHPDRFPILTRCCQEVITVSCNRLARRYGVPQATLQTALTNPTICGWPSIHWGPVEGEDHYRRLPRDQWRWCGRENTTYPHACTRAQFDLIQEVMRARKAMGIKTVGAGGWCRDVVQFPGYPGRAHLSSCRVGTVPNMHGRAVYEVRDGKQRTAYIERDKAHAVVLDQMQSLLADPRAILVRLEKVARTLPTAAPLPAPDRSASLASFRRRYQEAVDAEFDAAPLLREALTRRRQRLEGEVLALEASIGEAHEQTLTADSLSCLIARLPRIAGRFAAYWEEAAEEERRQLTGDFVAQVEVRIGKTASGRIREREVERVLLKPWFSGS